MELNVLVNEVIEKGIVSITFSNPFKKSFEYRKVNIQKIDDIYQVSSYTETQVFHNNITYHQLEVTMLELFTQFKQMDGKVRLGDYNVRVNKKGSVMRRFSEADYSDVELSHNRSKNYVLSNYKDLDILKDLGIVSKENEVINAMYDKFKQINKYIELVDDLIKNDNLKSLTVVDFGSGKSYLTFLLYEYLANVLKIDVTMYGIDLKESVIKQNIDLASKYHYDSLHFIYGDINDIELENVDMMISLHACDIATDLALHKALEWKVDYIVSVPCCQNELYTQLASKNFQAMLDFNIIKERLSALITDTVRANVLQYKGYNTQVIEYIDSDHSLKNVMIRERFNHNYDQKALQNIVNLQAEYGFKQTLLELQNINTEQ